MPETPQNTLATVHTEAFFGNLGAFSTTLGTSLQDGNINLAEGINIALGLVPFGDSVQNFKGKTYAEIKDLHPQEVENVQHAFAKRFDLVNNEVEQFIEDCVEFALRGTALYNSARRLFSKNA